LTPAQQPARAQAMATRDASHWRHGTGVRRNVRAASVPPPSAWPRCEPLPAVVERRRAAGAPAVARCSHARGHCGPAGLARRKARLPRCGCQGAALQLCRGVLQLARRSVAPCYAPRARAAHPRGVHLPRASSMVGCIPPRSGCRLPRLGGPCQSQSQAKARVHAVQRRHEHNHRRTQDATAGAFGHGPRRVMRPQVCPRARSTAPVTALPRQHRLPPSLRVPSLSRASCV